MAEVVCLLGVHQDAELLNTELVIGFTSAFPGESLMHVRNDVPVSVSRFYLNLQKFVI